MLPPKYNSAQARLRERNLATILRCLQEDSPLSRAQLAPLTRLNKSTVSSLIEELVDRGLIHEVGRDTSGAGRPATLLTLNPQAGHIIGVELGVGFILALVTDFSGNVVWRRQEETGPSSKRDAIIEQTLQLVDKAIAVNRAQNQRLLGLGLTCPGMVDVESGTLLFSPNLQWRNVALGPILKSHTGLPVFVDNDANAAAVGEHFLGVARQAHSFIFVVIGVGVGGGLFLNGHLYRGVGGLAGEIGHANFTVDRNRPCRCGSRGCWENSGNETALLHRVRALLDVGRESVIPGLITGQNDRLSLPLIKKAADDGDAVALEALTETGDVIGIGLANLINIFNPELIVIGGAMSLVGSYLLPAIRQQVEIHALAEMRRQTQVDLSTFGSEAIVMGAIALVMEDVLSHPSSVGRYGAI